MERAWRGSGEGLVMVSTLIPRRSVDVHSQLGSGGAAVRVQVREHGEERALSVKLATEAMTGIIIANVPCSRPDC